MRGPRDSEETPPSRVIRISFALDWLHHITGSGMLGHIVWRKRWDPGALSPGPLGVVATSGISILSPPSPYFPPYKTKSFEEGGREPRSATACWPSLSESE